MKFSYLLQALIFFLPPCQFDTKKEELDTETTKIVKPIDS